MGVEEVPRSFLYTCDGCGEKHEQKNAAGHYTDSRPPNWTRLKWQRDATDFQGAAVAYGSVERLLCLRCSEVIGDAINDALMRREAK